MDVVELKILENYSLELSFENGEKGVVNLKDYRNKGAFSVGLPIVLPLLQADRNSQFLKKLKNS